MAFKYGLRHVPTQNASTSKSPWYTIMCYYYYAVSNSDVSQPGYYTDMNDDNGDGDNDE